MRALFHFLESRPGRILRYGISSALLVGFVAFVDWGQFGRLRGQFSAGPVALAVFLAGLSYPLHAWRWWMLYRAQGLTLSLSWSHMVTWIANFYGAFLLGGLGGDAARAFYVCRDAPDQKAAGLASIAIDRLLGLLILLAMALAAFLAKAGDATLASQFRTFAQVGGGLLLVGTVGGTLLLARAPRRWPQWLRNRLGQTACAQVEDLRARTLAAPGVHLWAFVLSTIVWLLDFVSVWLLASGVGLRLPFFETCIAVSVAYASTALPISIGGHGVREGALLFVLGAFGLIAAEGPDRERALLLAVLVWAVTMIWSLVGGVVLVFTRQERAPAPLP